MFRDPRWIVGLMALDREIAEEIRQLGCGCGGRLHRADFPRKGRGLPIGLDAAPSRRIAFCCDRDGCRSRTLPPSVIWLGRRVYVGVAVLLGAALRNGPTPARVRRVCELTGASERTLRRWVQWWLETFTETPTWRLLRSRLLTRDPSAESTLPRSLLDAAHADDPVATITRVMVWLLPLTSSFALPPGSRFSMVF